MAAETESIAQALIKAEGHIGKAARALGMTPDELRRRCLDEPRLVEAALEATELALDEAEAELMAAMRVGPLANRLQAAGYIVRRSRR